MLSLTAFENLASVKRDCRSIRLKRPIFLSPGDERVEAQEPGQLHRVVHGRQQPLGHHGVPGRRSLDRRRHRDHHEGGTDSRRLQRGDWSSFASAGHWVEQPPYNTDISVIGVVNHKTEQCLLYKS